MDDGKYGVIDFIDKENMILLAIIETLFGQNVMGINQYREKVIASSVFNPH